MDWCPLPSGLDLHHVMFSGQTVSPWLATCRMLGFVSGTANIVAERSVFALLLPSPCHMGDSHHNPPPTEPQRIHPVALCVHPHHCKVEDTQTH